MNCSSVVSLAELVAATTVYIKGRKAKAYSQGSRNRGTGEGERRCRNIVGEQSRKYHFAVK